MLLILLNSISSSTFKSCEFFKAVLEMMKYATGNYNATDFRDLLSGVQWKRMSNCGMNAFISTHPEYEGKL